MNSEVRAPDHIEKRLLRRNPFQGASGAGPCECPRRVRVDRIDRGVPVPDVKSAGSRRQVTAGPTEIAEKYDTFDMDVFALKRRSGRSPGERCLASSGVRF